MRIPRSSLAPLVLVLLSSFAARAEDHRTEQSKISASLRIGLDPSANQTGRPTSGRENQTGEGLTVRRSLVSTQKLTALLSGRGSNNNSRPATETAVELQQDTGIVSGSNGTRENGTRDLALPIGPEIAGILSEDVTESEETPEELPEAQELKFIRTTGRRRPVYRPPPRRPTSTNRRNVYSESSRKPVIRPPRRPTEVKRGPSEKECTFFTTTVCLEAIDYPHEAILRSLRGNKQMVSALLTDYKSQEETGSEESAPVALPLQDSYSSRYENRYESNEIKRRSDSSGFDNIEEGFTCPSIVKYARPQLARAASGLWKYIINTGEHTQTLRLEKCSNPDSSCSFISENYRSSCVQVYNYHRLLTWDSKLGLHMDIFKVPTCCSCHVHGYAEIFPPHQKDPPPGMLRESFPGADFASTSDQKLDFQDLTRPGYLQKLSTAFDPNLGSSNKKSMMESAPNRPSLTVPGRSRPKKPAPVPRPFDKLPQQHAPNTRAPGYTGPLSKGSRPTRLTRPPFRRESSSQYIEAPVETTTNSSILNRYSQMYDQEVDASTRLRLQNGGFDDEYQEPQRRINYNYHPIIDFFKPEASMLQSAEPQLATQPAPVQTDANSWRPISP